MKKALIIYGTTTGNTEDMARMVQKNLAGSGIEAALKDVTDATVGDLTAGHDLVLLGCPAYGYDTVELQDEFAGFYEQMLGLALEEQKFAVFAPGDSSYEYFCGSVDLLEERMEELGAEKVADGLKIDGDPRICRDEILAWTESIAQAVLV